MLSMSNICNKNSFKVQICILIHYSYYNRNIAYWNMHFSTCKKLLVLFQAIKLQIILANYSSSNMTSLESFYLLERMANFIKYIVILWHLCACGIKCCLLWCWHILLVHRFLFWRIYLYLKRLYYCSEYLKIWNTFFSCINVKEFCISSSLYLYNLIHT